MGAMQQNARVRTVGVWTVQLTERTQGYGGKTKTASGFGLEAVSFF